MKSLKYNAIMNAILSIANIIFPLITFPYVTRTLGVEVNGKLAFASSVINYFSLFATLGLSTYGIKACAKVRDDKEKLSKTVQELILINVITTSIVMVALIISIVFVPKFNANSQLLIIYSFTMLLNVVGLNWFYSAIEEYKYITKRSIIFKLISLIMMFIFVHNPSDGYIYAIITVLATVGSNILNIIHSRKFIFFKRYNNYNLKPHLKPTLAMFGTYLAVNVYSNLDNVMLGFISGDFEVGIYTAAVKIRLVLTNLITSLGNVLMPRLSYYIEKGEHDNFKKVLIKSYSYIIMIAIPMMVFFCVESKESILLLSGDKYVKAIIPMIILMPIMVISSLSNITGMQILIPNNQENKFMKSVMFGAGVNLILNSILMPRYGAIGAAVSTLIAECGQFTMQINYTRKYVKDIFSLKQLGKVVLATIISAIALIISKHYMNVSFINTELRSLIVLIIGGIVFFAIYSFILIIVKFDMILDLKNSIFNKVSLKDKNKG